MVHLPQQQKGHAGLANRRLHGTQVWVLPYPGGKTDVRVFHLSPQGSHRESFSSFNTATPSSDINTMTRCSIPAHKRTSRRHAEGGNKGDLTGKVSQDLGNAADPVGEGAVRGVGEVLLDDPLEELQEHHCSSAFRQGARLGV